MAGMLNLIARLLRVAEQGEASTIPSPAAPAAPPSDVKELLHRYAKGERRFYGVRLDSAVLSGARLDSINLDGARLMSADLSKTSMSHAWLERANLTHANLTESNLDDSYINGASMRGALLDGATCAQTILDSVNLVSAKLRGANLRGASLISANLQFADMTAANLTDANVGDAHFYRTTLDGAIFSGAQVGGATFRRVNLLPICAASPPVRHVAPSTVDFASVILSLRAPNLASFLQRTGMPEIFVEYMIECAQSLSGSIIKKLLQSTFISYGGPDELFARKLYEALHRNGVTTFFFPEHAKPGQRIGRVVRENVESYDRILLLCSKTSLDRPGVLYEIEEALDRERRAGGADYLIPVILDDHLLSGWKPERPDVARALQGRVVADFRNADGDEEKFNAGLRKLIGALRPPEVALWRPSSASKPPEP